MPGGPRKTTFSLRGDEVQGAQVGDQVAFEAAGVVEVELLQGLAGREPGGADPALAAVGLPGGDLALQAGDQELLVGPGLGAGPFGQPGHRLAQRRRLQRPGQEGDLGGQVTALSSVGGSGRGHHATAVRQRRGRGRCRSRPGSGSRTSAVRGPGAAAPIRSRRSAFAAATCSGSVMRLVPGPDPVVVGDQPPVAEQPAPGPGRRRPRSGGRSPPGAPSSRWSPGGRSGRGAAESRTATRSPARPAAAPASLRGRRRSGRSGRSPAPAAVARFTSVQPALQLGVEVGRAGERAAGQERASPGSRGPAR